MDAIEVDREVGPGGGTMQVPFQSDERRLERLRRQRAIEPDRLRVREEWVFRLLARAGEGGTY